MGIINISSVGKRLKEAREKMGLSQQKFCDTFSESFGTNLNFNTYKAWENGINHVPIRYIPALCEFLDCDVGYLFGEYKEKRRIIADIHAETGLSEEAIKKLQEYKRESSMKIPESYSQLTANRIKAGREGRIHFLNHIVLSGLSSLGVVFSEYEEAQRMYVEWEKEYKKRIDSLNEMGYEKEDFRQTLEHNYKEAEFKMLMAISSILSKDIKTAPGDTSTGSGKTGQKASGPLPSQDNTEGRP